MIQFNETKDGYVFFDSDQTLAIGVYECAQFLLLHKEEVLPFGNAMQAFAHLRSIYEPFEPSPRTVELFTTPSRPIDNMSRWKNNPALIDMPKEVFHANLYR